MSKREVTEAEKKFVADDIQEKLAMVSDIVDLHIEYIGKLVTEFQKTGSLEDISNLAYNIELHTTCINHTLELYEGYESYLKIIHRG